MKITKKLAAIFVSTFAALSLTACSNSGSGQSIENMYENSSSTTSSSSASTSSSTASSVSEAISNTTYVESSTDSIPTENSSTTNSGENASSVENSSETPDRLETSNTESNVIQSEESSSESVSETQPATSESGKILVAYFSWSGTSESIANNIISNTGADFYRIERDIPYSDDYNTVAYGEAKDEADSNARPPLKNAIDSIDQYDTIVLCYPIWWHTCPMTIGTFLNKFDFSGKMVIPVSQSASMDEGQYAESVQFIRDNAANATVSDGVFSKDQSAINNYLAQNGVK